MKKIILGLTTICCILLTSVTIAQAEPGEFYKDDIGIYCLDNNRDKLIGWHTINNDLHYFDSTGHMAVSTYIDGKFIDEHGCITPNCSWYKGYQDLTTNEDEPFVYITVTGEYYHTTCQCNDTMNQENTFKVSKSSIKGLKPCPICISLNK